MGAARAASHAAQQIEDLSERRSGVTAASRDTRYFVERLRTSQLTPDPVARDTVAFGSVATFVRDHGQRMTYRILEADPRAGSISYVFPVARALIGRRPVIASFLAIMRSRSSPRIARACSLPPATSPILALRT